MIIAAVDGASRNNGKPHCQSSSGVVIIRDGVHETLSLVEKNSSNQRGELNAMLMLLRRLAEYGEDANVITDSEYIFNMLTKGWFRSWRNNNWITSAGTPVKNQDIIKPLVVLYEAMDDLLTLYHIKGHVIPIGEVTGKSFLQDDASGKLLYEHALDKFERFKVARAAHIEHAQEVSEKNNLFRLEDGILKTFVALNCTADVVATSCL